MSKNESVRYIAKTMFGMEELLQAELEALGADDIQVLRRAVSFHGDLEMMYRANLHLRTAVRVLKETYRFEADNEQELYDKAKAFIWEDHLSTNESLAIDAVVNSERFKHSKYASLKLKDAIVDRFREATGVRPNVDTENPDLLLNLHIHDRYCTISIDSSGSSLHQRGYKADGHHAPLNEILAAAMIMLSGWTKERPLLDPMCGSGTIAIEAAMIASGTAPGLFRKEFGFMSWPDFDKDLWEFLKTEARQNIDPSDLNIFASDISGLNVRIARTSAQVVGLEEHIDFSKRDFFDMDDFQGVLIMNPPYGERIRHKNIEEFYIEMADHLKHHFAGSECWLISSNQDALKGFGLRPTRRITLFNGALECKFQRFEMYEGSKKGKYMDNDYSEKSATRHEKPARRSEPDRTEKAPRRSEPRATEPSDRGTWRPDDRIKRAPRRSEPTERSKEKDYKKKDERSSRTAERGTYKKKDDRGPRPAERSTYKKKDDRSSDSHSDRPFKRREESDAPRKKPLITRDGKPLKGSDSKNKED